MMDIRQDMKQAEAWLEKTNGEMSEEQLIYLAATGFVECSDFCGSKEYCEDGACACIRATFPTPDHYHFYLALRETYVGWMKQGIVAGSVDKEAFYELKARRK